MLNDVTLRLYNLHHGEPLPRQSHIIYCHDPLPTSSIVNPIWLYAERCWKRDLQIWLCIYNVSFWTLTQAIFITKLLWRTNSQLTKTEDSMLIPPLIHSVCHEITSETSHPKQSRWVHWAMCFATLDLYVPRLKVGSASDSAEMPYPVEAKELLYLPLFKIICIFRHLYHRWIERIWQDWNVWMDALFCSLCLRGWDLVTPLR